VPADDATRVAPTHWQDSAPTVAVAQPRRRRRWIAAAAVLGLLAAAAALIAVLALRSSGTEATPPEPTLRAFVLTIEPILRESAAARLSIGETISNGFSCEISPSEAHTRMDKVVRQRRKVLARVSRITDVPPEARKTLTRLEAAINQSIDADILYRSGFGSAAGCPPQSEYFNGAADADALATRAKKRFVAAFNRLATRVGLTTWSASEI
jgi:hypothetical protein